MAVRKLSLPLFSAKTRVSQPGCSTRCFHFIATVSQKTDQYALVCESQPLMTSLTRSRRNIQNQRASQLSKKRFTVR
jgi:hypothetical protein